MSVGAVFNSVQRIWQFTVASAPELIALILFAVTWGITLDQAGPQGPMDLVYWAQGLQGATSLAYPGLDNLPQGMSPLWTLLSQTLSHFVFGVSPWAAKLPGLVTTMLALVATYLWMLSTFQSRWMSWLAALLLGSSTMAHQWVHTVTAQPMVWTCFLIWAGLAIQWYRQTDRFRPKSYQVAAMGRNIALTGLLSWVCGGWWLLLSGLGVYLVYFYIHNAAQRGWNPFGKSWLKWTGGCVAVALTLGWLILSQAQLLSWQTLLAIPTSHPFQAPDLGDYSANTLMHWFQDLLIGTFPWSLVTLGVLLEMTRRKRSSGRWFWQRPQFQPVSRGLLVWLLGAFLLSAWGAWSGWFDCTSWLCGLTAIMAGLYFLSILDFPHSTKIYAFTVDTTLIAFLGLSILLSVVIFLGASITYFQTQWLFPGLPVLREVDLAESFSSMSLAFGIPFWKLWLLPWPLVMLLGSLAAATCQIFNFRFGTPILLALTLTLTFTLGRSLGGSILASPVEPTLSQIIQQPSQGYDPQPWTLALLSPTHRLSGLPAYLPPQRWDQVHIFTNPTQFAESIVPPTDPNQYPLPRWFIVEEEAYYQLPVPLRLALPVVHQWVLDPYDEMFGIWQIGSWNSPWPEYNPKHPFANLNHVLLCQPRGLLLPIIPKTSLKPVSKHGKKDLIEEKDDTPTLLEQFLQESTENLNEAMEKESTL